MKPNTFTAKPKESLFNTAKRILNQAILNNSIVNFQYGEFTCLVYPMDNIFTLLKEFKIIELKHKINSYSNPKLC